MKICLSKGLLISTVVIVITFIGVFQVIKDTPILKNTDKWETSAVSSAEADESGWCLTLVNRKNPIKNKPDISLKTVPGGEKVDERIYPALKKMFEAAENDKIYPAVISGYRTAKQQQRIYNGKIKEYMSEGCTRSEAENEAQYWAATPDTSEHRLGIAVDIDAADRRSSNEDVYKWLKNNAYLYGFILRYPPEKSDITGIANEPWHYRYVGVKAATEIHKNGLCFEEYINNLN